jgi:hypothetical protein
MKDSFRYDEVLRTAAVIAAGMASRWALGPLDRDEAGSINELAAIAVAAAAAVILRARALTEPVQIGDEHEIVHGSV